jgi:lipopolysaccharide/colanic/teichoic acid biosynthesis glycosyltransferase
MTRWLAFRVRYVDRLLAAALLVALSPLLALVAGAVRLVDGPPVLVRLPRVGRNGLAIALVKFRTMRQPAGALRADGAPITARDDPRVTSLGRTLRKYRLDELPQLWHVVRGEMALLGPRPETPEYVDLTDERWRLALTMGPGIAGPTQVLASRWEADLPGGEAGERRYRDVVLPAKLAIDTWYLASASPMIDLATIGAVVRQLVGMPPGAYLQRRLPLHTP